MESNEILKNPTKLPPKPRRLPEIPKDQEPYDVTKAPKKPPRQRPGANRCSTPDLHRRSSRLSSSHKRSRSLTESRRLSGSRRSSVCLEDEGNTPLVGVNGNLRLENSSEGRQAAFTTNINQTKHVPSRKESSLLPAYCGEDAIFNRRCTTCHQRIFPEEEHYLIAQSMLFHVACFRCSICTTCVDVTDYCYVTEHEKFYCLRHYHEIIDAGIGIGNEGRVVNGIGPGAFAVVLGRRRNRKETVQSLTELQERRTKLAQVAFQLEEAMKSAKCEEEPFLWKHWFDVTYEKIMVARMATELAYQLKEVELFDEQEQLERELRRIRKEQRKGDRERNAEEEEKNLHAIVNVIEKRDLLLLELEIERKRFLSCGNTGPKEKPLTGPSGDNDEAQKLKSTFRDQSKTNRSQKVYHKELSSSNEDLSYKGGQNGLCVVL